MSVIRIDREPADAPVVRHPLLQGLVDEARAQPLPALRVDPEHVRKEWMARRRARRWTLLAGAAAVLLAFGIVRAIDGPVQTRPSSVSPTAPELASAVDGRDAPEPSPIASAEIAEPSPTGTSPIAPPRLAEGVIVEPDGPDASPAVVVGTWEVQVAAGQYDVEVPVEAVSTLRVVVGRHRLEVQPGTALRLIGTDPPRVEVERGHALLIDAAGNARELVPMTATSPSSATELARRAEAQMARGDVRGAIRTLEQLVRKHPRSSAAKSGLLDLARLRKTHGDEARARCAYVLYLERWPDSPLRADVDRALAGMKPGACRGLSPSKR